jgi:methylenetetrahydrofolate dehydrogenase (NADP+) / methenyltetrahydrofolate cyclohydrolase
VRRLSADDTVDGILVQHPMPAQIDERAVFEAIAPEKDVDGVTAASFAAIAVDGNGFRSYTPVGMLLLARDVTVTYCHSHTVDLPGVIAEADIVVAAVGIPELIKGAWIKPASVVIDASYNPGNVGDVEYAVAAERARLITPVPG